MWPQIALFIASLVISYMLQPKPQKNKPAAFEDFDFPTVDDGTPQIVVFGDVWLTDWTVIGVGNYRNKTIVAKQSGLFGSKKADAGFRYFMSIHMGLSRAVDDMIEIKVSDRTVWTGNLANSNESTISINQPDIFGGDKGEGGIVGQLKVLRGAADQPILNELAMMYGTVIQEGYFSLDGGDGYYSNGPKWIPPVIEPAVVPAYRGVVTFFYDGLICSNSPYPKPWSFRVRRTVSGWDGSVWYPEKATIWLNDNKIKAMNAAHILYEAQTNRMWGRGFSASQLDLDSYQTVADQLYAEGFGICLAWRRQESLSEFMQQIINQIGAAQFVDRTTGLWKLVLIRDNYVVADLQNFSNATGLLRVEDDNNASNDLVTNLTVVSYRDPITNQDQQIRAENLAAIQKNGAILENKTYSGIPTASLAGRLAARDMKISQSSLKKFKLILDRRAYAIQPASVFKVALPERGIDSIVVRAVRVEHDTITNGEITVTVIQDVFGLPATNYIQEQPNLWQPPNFQAESVKRQFVYEVPYTELLGEFTALELASQNDQCYIGVVAQQPSSLQLDFTIWGKKTSEAIYQKIGTGDFGFYAETTEIIPQSKDATTCVFATPIDNIEIGSRAFLGDEIVSIKSINHMNNSITFDRGFIDTVPIAHLIGTPFCVYSNISSTVEKPFNGYQSVDLKLLTRTNQNELSLNAATTVGITTQKRQERPYAPCNVKLNNQYFPQQVSGDLSFTWSHRNRLSRSESMTWLNGSTAAEEGTTYHLKITDGQHSILLDEQVPGTNFDWSIPKIFDGEMTTVLNVAMTGTNNSQSFVDTSANSHVINNYNTIIQSDSNATGGSSAMFDIALLKTATEASKLQIYNTDHCIEFSVKTAATTDYLDIDPNTLFIRIDHERHPSESISTHYKSIAITPYTDAIKVILSGTVHDSGWIGTDKDIICHVENLTPNQFYDVAIQAISDGTVIVEGAEYTKFLITIFVGGVAQTTDFVHVLTHDYPCSVKVSLSPNYMMGSLIALNAFRITKRLGGRYSTNYTPATFPVGTSDPYWNDVVLLIPMNGDDGGHAFLDVSNNAIAISATDAVMTKTFASARGGSAAYFYFSMLAVASHADFNLRNASFSIEGRAKGRGEIFRLTESMNLRVDGNSLTLSNIFSSNPTDRQTVVVNHFIDIENEYFDFKIMRDAGTGTVMLWLNNLSQSGQFNPWQTTEDSSLLIGLFDRDATTLKKSYFNGLKIETAAEGAGLVPNVVNPLVAELSAVRGGLSSYQKLSMQFEVVG